LEQRSEEDTVIELGADGTQIPIVQLLAHSLGLKDLGFAFAATLAEHASV
jgi:hypothetical protein